MSVISLEYFSYKTNTKVVLRRDHKFNNPSIVFCIRYTDIIDRTNYQKYGIHQKGSYNSAEYMSDQSKLQINDIFDLTPKPDNVITGCRMRENEYTLQSKNNCYSLFNVTKYLEGGFICYQFRTKIVESKFRCDQAALSYRYMSQLYSVSLHPRFKLSNLIKLISFIPRDLNGSLPGLPYVSRTFYDTIVRYGHDAPNTARTFWIAISGDLYIVSRLQSPYDTHCVKNKEEAQFYCNRRCNIAAFRRHGLFPTTEWTTSPLPMKHLNLETLKNESLLRDVKARNDECMINCYKHLCYDWYSVTTTKTIPFKEEGLTISSNCSKRPAVMIQYFPRITFMELAMYASSSLGIWFGVSFFAINPFKGNQKHLRKTRRQGIDLRCLRQRKCDSTISLQILVQDLQLLVHDLDRRMRQIENRGIH